MNPPIPRYRQSDREIQVWVWLCHKLNSAGIVYGKRRLTARAREDAVDMIKREGDPSHDEIVRALRSAKSGGLQMSGDLINIPQLPAISAALREIEHGPD